MAHSTPAKGELAAAAAQEDEVVDGRCGGLEVLTRHQVPVQDHVQGIFLARYGNTSE